MRRKPALTVATVLTAVTVALIGTGDAAGADERPSPHFCLALARVDAVGSPGGPQAPTTAELKAWARRVAVSTRTMNRNAPAKLKPHTGAMVNAMDAAARGDVNGATSDVAAKARERVDAYAYDNCGWRRLNITGRDYKFTNVPEVLPRGINIVRLRNKGDEFHVLLWQRRKPFDRRAPQTALTEDWAKLMTNPTPARARALGFLDWEAAGAPPDGTGYAAANLSRGRYIVFCPVHVEGGDDAHLNRGMWDALDVP